MTKADVSSSRIVTRRAFLYSSAAMLAEVSVLKNSSALVPPKNSSPTDYSSAIEKIKQTLPIAMAGRDITGASIALVDGDNIVWSEGFGYTNRSLKVKVTGDTQPCQRERKASRITK